MNKNMQGIILAAGKSTRFNTGKTKLLEKLCGQEMVIYITKLLARLQIQTTVVVGYQKEDIIHAITQYHGTHITCITQEEQRGTGDALICTQDNWYATDLLILNGDIPLITDDIIEELYKQHCLTQAAISFVTAHHPESKNSSYGRVIQDGARIKIIEAADIDESGEDNRCVNAGIYIINRSFLENFLTHLNDNNSKNEFYITDLVRIASDNGLTVVTAQAPFDYIRGINTFQELWAAEQIKKSELIKYWMDQGVAFMVPQSTIIELDVTIGARSRIGCGAHIMRGSTIGQQCDIQAFSWIENSTIGDNTTILAHSIVKDSTIGSHTHIGPFAHIRHNTHVNDHSIIGNFVETKNSIIGAHTKAKHLAYLGDATIGSHVNIGAGTITCNHDGMHKHETTIMDHAYIGSNNTLIAPVTIGYNAFTAAGSVITHAVPAHALAIARERQVNKDGYALKLRALHHRPEVQEQVSNEAHFSFVGAKKIMYDDSTPEDV